MRNKKKVNNIVRKHNQIELKSCRMLYVYLTKKKKNLNRYYDVTLSVFGFER